MKKSSNLTLAFVLPTLIILMFIISCTAQAPATTSATDGDIKKLLDVLDEAGFYVQEGEYSHADAIALCNAGVIKTCQGNAVGAPYLAYKLPPAPDQTTSNMFADSRGWAYAYRLRPDEAILQIGRTPPESRYFSYQSYLCQRYDTATRQYIPMYDSLGNTINPLTINTQGKEVNPFDQPVIFITTADKGIDAMVRTAVEKAGYPSSIINTDVIPSSIVNMGLEKDDDMFQFLSRIAVPEYKAALDAYINDPGSTVLRLTPKTPAELDSFPTPELRVRGTGKTEMDLLPAVYDLRAAILAKYSNLEAMEVPTYMIAPEGYTAIQSNINMLGENHDSAYFSTLDMRAWTDPNDPQRDADFALGDDPDEFFIMFGVNHETTGKATYSSCTVYGMKYLNGVASISSNMYQGSAQDYLPGHAKAQYLYAWKIARSCNGQAHCLEVPEGPLRYGIETDDKIILVFRNYLEKATKTGPAHVELVTDRVIKFRPKK